MTQTDNEDGTEYRRMAKVVIDYFNDYQPPRRVVKYHLVRKLYHRITKGVV